MTFPVQVRPVPGRPVCVAGIRLPDSAAAVTAERVCRNVSTEILYSHTTRSFLFAALLAQRASVKLDEEALYIGSILHDLASIDR